MTVTISIEPAFPRLSMWRGAVVALATTLLAPSAAAQEGLAATLPRCAIRGTGPMPAEVVLYMEGTGGIPHARFSGASSALVATTFPAEGEGRVRVQTGLGLGGFRLVAFVESSDVHVSTKGPIPVVEGHVWIGEHQEVSVVDVDRGRALIEKRLGAPFAQTLRTWEACDRFVLFPEPDRTRDVIRDEAGFAASLPETELFSVASARDSAVFRARPRDGGEIVFRTLEQDGDWVRVEYRGEIVVDAWARRGDLRPVTLADIPAPSVTLEDDAPKAAPGFVMKGVQSTVTPDREIELRLGPSVAARVIGHIERKTPTLVVQVSHGWASVVPRSLNVVPTTGHEFWAKASDLGL